MSSQPIDSNQSFEAVYLVGVRIDPLGRGDVLYTLLLMDEDSRGGKDRPLTDSEGYVVWFTHTRDAETALLLGDEGFRQHSPAPDDVAFVYEYPRLFWTVTTCDADEGSVILNGVNFLLDLVEATAFPIPNAYQTTLFRLADHLTFSNDLGALVRERAEARREVMDALTWCVGAVTIKSRLLSASRAK